MTATKGPNRPRRVFWRWQLRDSKPRGGRRGDVCGFCRDVGIRPTKFPSYRAVRSEPDP